VISAGATIKINGAEIRLEALPQKLASPKPDSIVVLPEPDLEMQRLAEDRGVRRRRVARLSA
jgi:hypothetical protein